MSSPAGPGERSTSPTDLSDRPVSALHLHPEEDQLPMWVCEFPADEPGGWGVHHHQQHQIAWVSRGRTTAHVGDRTWVLPPSQALWIPGGVPHDLTNRPPSVLHCLYVWPDACPVAWVEPTVLAVTPLVRELLLCLSRPGLTTTVSEAGTAMLFALLEPLGQPGVDLPLPVDDRAAELARALLDRPWEPGSLEMWAGRLATSASTLRRAFLAETGLTFSEWRTQARLRAALPLLADRVPVDRVATQVGYASANGFVEAFRRHFGHTPGAHYR